MFFLTGLLYGITSGEKLSEIYKRAMSYKSNTDSSFTFPEDLSEKFIDTIKNKLDDTKSQGYLGMAMLYIFWTQKDLKKFRKEFYQAEKWNCYIMASFLQKLNQFQISFDEEKDHEELYSWIDLNGNNLPSCPEGCDAHNIFDDYQ